MKKTCVYVDGFNLYYGILAHYRKAYPKDNNPIGVKWLDINTLVKGLLNESHEIVKINYFTAEIKSPTADIDFQQKITRQRLYIRALESNSNTSVVMGCFKERQQTFKMPDPPFTKYKYSTFSEKGTDVNIATWMLRDAFKSSYAFRGCLSPHFTLFTTFIIPVSFNQLMEFSLLVVMCENKWFSFSVKNR